MLGPGKGEEKKERFFGVSGYKELNLKASQILSLARAVKANSSLLAQRRTICGHASKGVTDSAQSGLKEGRGDSITGVEKDEKGRLGGGVQAQNFCP